MIYNKVVKSDTKQRTVSAALPILACYIVPFTTALGAP
ncbi:hypothetical protein PLUTE_a4091 [Pseudoalteromonas luteoviolacea DSM 6061]|nr:hypothetical protein [Pseudoalteromonas luteoviolacea DSM 6061]